MTNLPTPGPWFEHGSSIYSNSPQRVDPVRFFGFEKKEWDGGILLGYLIAESIPHDATRKLIAASPDLLDACMQIVQAHDNKDAALYESGIQDAKAAIAKAKGEQE